MKELLLVGFGGMLGSMARYLSGAMFLHAFPATKFPWGTFFVNVVGCLLIGILSAASQRLFSYNAELRLFLITGLLGGFTTFSAFGLETANLLRSGELATAILYALSSLLLGLLAVFIGLAHWGS